VLLFTLMEWKLSEKVRILMKLRLAINSVTIGSKHKISSFQGTIKDLRIWACILTEDEICISMNTEYLEYTPKLIGWWPLMANDKYTPEIEDFTHNSKPAPLCGPQWR